MDSKENVMNGIGVPELGLGFGALIAGFVVYVLVLLIMLWIFYLIIRAAVTSGIMRASARGAFTAMSQSAPPQQFSPHPPQQQMPGPGGPTQYRP